MAKSRSVKHKVVDVVVEEPCIEEIQPEVKHEPLLLNYEILEEFSTEMLGEVVNLYVCQGYRPVGGVCVHDIGRDIYGNPVQHYFQAVIKNLSTQLPCGIRNE